MPNDHTDGFDPQSGRKAAGKLVRAADQTESKPHPQSSQEGTSRPKATHSNAQPFEKLQDLDQAPPGPRKAKVQAVQALQRLKEDQRRGGKSKTTSPVIEEAQIHPTKSIEDSKAGAQRTIEPRPSIHPLTEKALRALDTTQSPTQSNQRRHQTDGASALDTIRRPIVGSPNCPLPTVERRSSDKAASSSLRRTEVTSDSDEPSNSSTDTETAFNQKWGYLPPLDPETTALIETIINNPAMGKSVKRISPSDPTFDNGLSSRNVSLNASQLPDPLTVNFEDLVGSIPKEDKQEKKAHDQLWSFDSNKCLEYSNEALFQRTLMMSLIGRNYLIHNAQGKESLFDYSVEELWTCFPMPTRDHHLGQTALTQPKPDLSICFSRQPLIEDKVWRNLPRTVQRLACYEKFDRVGENRVFHFFTIEAKKALTPVKDLAGTRQNLNCASQSLHNLYEFFHEAGDDYDKIFLEEVRCFSAVATTEGFFIRIHRAVACEVDNRIIPDYPLKFEFRDFAHIKQEDFSRERALNAIGKILYGQIIQNLRKHLEAAASEILLRLNNDHVRLNNRGHNDFFRYGASATGSAITTHALTPDTSVPTSARQSAQSTPSSNIFHQRQSEAGTATPQQGAVAATNTVQSFTMSDAPPMSPANSVPPSSPQNSQSGRVKRGHPDPVPSERRGGRPRPGTTRGGRGVRRPPPDPRSLALYRWTGPQAGGPIRVP